MTSQRIRHRRWTRPRRPNGVLGAGTAVLLTLSLLTAVPARARPLDDGDWRPAATPEVVPRVGSVPVSPAPARQVTRQAVRGTPPVSWPAAGRAVVAPAADRTGPGARAGTLPVTVGAPRSAAMAAMPSRVRVELYDRSLAERAGIAGLLLRVDTLDATSRGPVSVGVDYSSFRQAFGGDYASRLSLVRLPGCVLTTPAASACRAGTVLPSRNDVPSGRLTADVAVATAGDRTVLAVAAASGGSAGDFKPTSLSPSATWQVGLQSGDFTWSYPLALPQVPGTTPEIALSYSSGSVDGRTAATNNQASWIGEGFSYQPGFVERSYTSCAEDTKDASHTEKTGDRCWLTSAQGRVVQTVHLSLPGITSELVLDDTTRKWTAASDGGWKVELLTGADNGDDNGEHWLLTSRDGTRYYFGRHHLPGGATTGSTRTVPVYGNHPGEPCRAAAWAQSWCQQAYRWSLDYVVDRHGEAAAYFYHRETGHYGRANRSDSPTPYTRDGYLSRLDYGMREQQDSGLTEPAARVVFDVADRCIEGSACLPSQPADWPDTPWDQHCGPESCPVHAPTFWTSKRLATVTTQVRDGGDLRPVSSWSLRHQYLDPGDGTSPSLWLSSIQRTGRIGTDQAQPPVTFDGMLSANRVDAEDGVPEMKKWRVNRIVTESGGQVDVTYITTDCAAGSALVPDSNTRRCFPGYWRQPGQSEPALDWFAKNVVSRITETDLVGGGARKVNDYVYGGEGFAWHYDESELTPDEYRTWGQLRGYQKVTVRTGEATAGDQTRKDYLFLRGMHLDRRADGTTRTVQVRDSRGGSISDEQTFAGFAREEVVYDGDTVVSSTLREPWKYGPTATRQRPSGTLRAFVTDVERISSTQTLADGRTRTTAEENRYDAYGRLTRSEDLGDVSVGDDDTCRWVWYAENADRWILDTISRMQQQALACAATVDSADDVIADMRYFYDRLAEHGAPPTVGDVTRSEQAVSWNDNGPVYQVVESRTVDQHGRPREVTDALGNVTRTSYLPATGGPLTQTVTTNPLGHTETTELSPYVGEPTASIDANGRRTDLTYDPFGRLTEVWLPERSRAANESANVRFEYLLRNDGPSVVTVRTLQSSGSDAVTATLHDGFLRTRQTQRSSPAGGRMVTDTLYDSHGRPYKTNDPYYSAGPPGGDLVGVTDDEVPAQKVTGYDRAGRPVTEVVRANGVERWRTTTSYGGDWIAVDPPAGGTASMKLLDARNQVTELRQFHGGAPSGTYDAATYRYTPSGALAALTDPAGNTWRYDYDLAGRRIRAEDPDAGISTTSYDAKGQPRSSTNGSGQRLTYVHDALGRKTAVRLGSETGPRLAEWIFDTLPGGKGLPSASVRYIGGHAYRHETLGYTETGRPTGTAVVLPPVEGALAGRYESALTYNTIGQIATASLPAAGGLPAETLQYGYHNLGMPTTLRSALTNYAVTTYSNLGQVGRHVFGPSGRQLMQQYTYDPLTGDPTRVQTSRQANPAAVTDLQYTRDAVGNMARLADTPAGGTADVQCFEYDHLRRTTEAWTPTSGDCEDARNSSTLGGAAPFWHSYAYDVAGNRVRETQHASAGDTTRDSTYPAAGAAQPHTLRSVVTTGPAGQHVNTFGYDSSGNAVERVTDGTGQRFAWDAEGHLESVSVGTGSVASYVYDAAGSRLIRRDATGTTAYLGGLELHLAAGTGAVTATRYYSHIDSTIAARAATGLKWLVSDHHATAVAAVDAGTLAVARRRSLPFGGPRTADPAGWPGERGFVGGTVDAATSLTHLGAREYDPEAGGFISVDPIIDHMDPQQVNGYAYGNNAPATLSDPDGLIPDCGSSRGCEEFNKHFKWNGSDFVSRYPEPPMNQKTFKAMADFATVAFSQLGALLGFPEKEIKYAKQRFEKQTLKAIKAGNYRLVPDGKSVDDAIRAMGPWAKDFAKLAKGLPWLGAVISGISYALNGDGPVKIVAKVGGEALLSSAAIMAGCGIGSIVPGPGTAIGCLIGGVVAIGASVSWADLVDKISKLEIKKPPDGVIAPRCWECPPSGRSV